MYTVYLTGRYAPGGQDWQIGKLISQSSFGVTLEDSRGERHMYPAGVIQRMTARAGW